MYTSKAQLKEEKNVLKIWQLSEFYMNTQPVDKQEQVAGDTGSVASSHFRGNRNCSVVA